jgi:cytoplasmic tRNA 2-thiolation protein 1
MPDSTVLAHVLSLLNQRYDYGLDLYLLSIDEGITGYRDDSLEVSCWRRAHSRLPRMIDGPFPEADAQTVKQNQVEYGLPLKILSYNELYGWTMDKIVDQIGKKNNCTFCGVFRRQALDRGAAQLGVDHIVTGHNADDIAETVLMNSELIIARNRVTKLTPVMRGDIARLSRCTAVTTQSEDTIKRSKPFKYAYEKEIVM